MSILQQTRPASKSTRKPLTVELTLTINGTCYTVEPIAHAPGALKSFRLAKVGGDSSVYDLDAFADRVTCTCPSYEKTHAGTSSLCKHGRALLMVGLIDYPDVGKTHIDEPKAPAANVPSGHIQEPAPVDPYTAALAKMTAIAEAELVVRGEGRAEHEVKVAELVAHREAEGRPAPAFDRGLYTAQNAVAEGKALWLEHRHLHTSEPIPGPSVPVPCCPVEESNPCIACVQHEGPADLSDDGWDDGHVWTITPDVEPGPDRRTLAGQVDVEARHYATLGTPFGELIAETLAKLAAECRFLDATSPDSYRDRREAALDAARVEAEARHASRCC